jgi:hypothetical protein
MGGKGKVTTRTGEVRGVGGREEESDSCTTHPQRAQSQGLVCSIVEHAAFAGSCERAKPTRGYVAIGVRRRLQFVFRGLPPGFNGDWPLHSLNPHQQPTFPDNTHLSKPPAHHHAGPK